MTGDDELREKLRDVVAAVGDRYFVDDATRTVAGETVDHWKLVLGSFSHLSAGNVLLVGEPGTGKTTFANVVAATLSGLPFDLFARTQIQGHPDQTKEEMLARAHVGKLTTEGEESVVWQNALFCPQVLVDEFNRLPEGKQSILQEFIRTGSVSHLNETFHRGDVPFAATVNEDDRGTYAITPPNRDRFDVSLELTHGAGWLQEHVQRAWERIQSDLVMPDRTTALLDRLGEDSDAETKLAAVRDAREDLRGEFEQLGLQPFSPAEGRTFRETVQEIPLSADAGQFVDFCFDECNRSSTMTHKRRSDDPARFTHDSDLAYGKLVNGLSARRRRALVTYARMLAFYLGDGEVTREHVRAVAPHCLAHALEFTDDFRADHADDRRPHGEREDEYLARTLVADVEDHYDDLAETIKLLNQYARGNELDDDGRETVERLLAGNPEPDHPHLRVWVENLRE